MFSLEPPSRLHVQRHSTINDVTVRGVGGSKETWPSLTGLVGGSKTAIFGVTSFCNGSLLQKIPYAYTLIKWCAFNRHRNRIIQLLVKKYLFHQFSFHLSNVLSIRLSSFWLINNYFINLFKHFHRSIQLLANTVFFHESSFHFSNGMFIHLSSFL